jgi:hypothetical protein
MTENTNFCLTGISYFNYVHLAYVRDFLILAEPGFQLLFRSTFSSL